MAGVSVHQIHLGQAEEVKRADVGIVGTVVRQIKQEILSGDLPDGEIGVVVAIMRDVLELVERGKRKEGLSATALEGIIKRIVVRIFADPTCAIRKNIDSILWGLRTAAAFDKEQFGGAIIEFAADTVPVEAVMASVQRVQAKANAASRKLSAGVLKHSFVQELAALNLHGEVAKEAKALVSAGLVTEVVGLLKDDGKLSNDIQNQLQTAGVRLALKAGSAIVQRCSSGKCNFKAIFCCCSGGSALPKTTARRR